MLYDPSTVPHLKPWLVRTLEPICDAEPGALAEYVLALLKHNVPENEMRKELTLQLEEFLEKEAPTFIDTLFTVLRTKSYLPYTDNAPTHLSYPSTSSTQQSSNVGIPIPLDGLLQNNTTSPERGQKRALEYDDQHPSKGPRLGADSHFNRYANGRDYRQWGEKSERPGIVNSSNQRIQTYQPPERRGICRDYHKNGYCARGAHCKYSHGDDAFVPTQLFPLNTSSPMPFIPMFPNGAMPFAMPGAGAAYDPHEARLDMHHPNGGMMDMNGGAQRPTVVPRRWQEDRSNPRASGELSVIQDLTPQDAAAVASSQPDQNGVQESSSSPSQGADMVVEDTVVPSTPSSRGMFTGRGSHRGRGTFPIDVQSFRPERRNDKTLVVEKIPQDKLSLDAVNGWFKRFGTVTNVAIDAHTSKALVSFSEHREAFAAWKSEDAVFSNRFVKVFWHRPLEGHGQKGTRMLAASAPLVASISGRPPAPTNSVSSTTPAQAEPTSSSTPAPAPAPTPAPGKPPVSTAASDLAAKQKLLEQQIAEQKSLMATLATASGEEKKSIMARLRKLGEEIQPSTAPTASSHSSSPAPSRVPEHEKKERDRLDRELESHHAASSVESTEELQAKLTKLKEEAASLGISSEHSYGSGAPGAYRPYRGRGRGGRSFIRGGARGGPPRSMKLDNRPRQLLIKSAAEDAIPTIRSWYETTGQLDSVLGEDGNVIVAFRTRAAAEQALAKGSDIPSVGTVQITWHTSQPSNANSQAPTVSSSPPAHADKITVEPHSSPLPQHTPPSPRRQEEEVVASGWGDGDEDGMGF